MGGGTPFQLSGPKNRTDPVCEFNVNSVIIEFSKVAHSGRDGRGGGRERKLKTRLDKKLSSTEEEVKHGLHVSGSDKHPQRRDWRPARLWKTAPN